MADFRGFYGELWKRPFSVQVEDVVMALSNNQGGCMDLKIYFNESQRLSIFIHMQVFKKYSYSFLFMLSNIY